jgi:hypothetical protein
MYCEIAAMQLVFLSFHLLSLQPSLNLWVFQGINAG